MTLLVCSRKSKVNCLTIVQTDAPNINNSDNIFYVEDSDNLAMTGNDQRPEPEVDGGMITDCSRLPETETNERPPGDNVIKLFTDVILKCL